MLTLFDNFYNGKKVFITGHTGFKGSWLSLLLHNCGAEVYGYALNPPTSPSLYDIAKIEKLVSSTIGDIRDYDLLLKTLKDARPEIIIHLAAQPIVSEGYKNPRGTFETNIMGTVNLLDAARQVNSVKAILNVTTDKCYENKEWHRGYREIEPLGGFDPYSNSKACSELVTSSFRDSFFNTEVYHQHGVAIATARAGNVIGGGDWAADRLIPDIFKAILHGNKVKIRNPYSVRPWQHVLESLTGYLLLCKNLCLQGNAYATAWNFGPDDADAQNVEWIANRIDDLWGDGFSMEIDKSAQFHETKYLKLDCSKAKAELGWQPRRNLDSALCMIVDWYKAFQNGEDMQKFTTGQIEQFYQ